jgi:hypothetical protein
MLLNSTIISKPVRLRDVLVLEQPDHLVEIVGGEGKSV